MDLFVESLSPDAAESRLRAARLHSPESEQRLYISIAVLDNAFSVSVRYIKDVYDPLSGLRYLAATWDTGGIGTHGGDSGYILSYLYRKFDQFLVEFLRVNEKACETR